MSEFCGIGTTIGTSICEGMPVWSCGIERLGISFASGRGTGLGGLSFSLPATAPMLISLSISYSSPQEQPGYSPQSAYYVRQQPAS